MSSVRHSRYYRPKMSQMSYPSARIHRTMEEAKLEIPPIDENSRYWYFTHRHQDDAKYIDKLTDSVENINSIKRTVKHFHDTVSREPSYTRFKVPFDMLCEESYRRSVKRYNDQLRHEIKNIIDNQESAREATYFVRVVSYTTLWPPYHSEREQNETSEQFYSLTPKERCRFRLIMSCDYSQN